MPGLKVLPFFIALNVLQLLTRTNLEAIMGSKNIHIYMWLYNTSIQLSLIKTALYLRVFIKTNDMYTYTHVFVIWMKPPPLLRACQLARRITFLSYHLAPTWSS